MADLIRVANTGDELFYRNGDKLMAVRVQTRAGFTPGKPSLLFKGRFYDSIEAGIPMGSYDVSADGQRFLMIRSAIRQPAKQINVVVNWFEDLKRRVPKASQ